MASFVGCGDWVGGAGLTPLVRGSASFIAGSSRSAASPAPLGAGIQIQSAMIARMEQKAAMMACQRELFMSYSLEELPNKRTTDCNLWRQGKPQDDALLSKR